MGEKFEAESVDEFIIDLDYTLVRMGLKEAEEMPPLSFEELLSRFRYRQNITISRLISKLLGKNF